MRTGTLFYATILIGSAVANGALAQENSGEALYMDSCAVCHGTSAIGDGPMREFMNVHVPNLRQLSQQNDGVFPMLEVIQVIDGRQGIRPHGTEMPFWGNEFKAEAIEDSGIYGGEIVARGKILSLALYLEIIQDE